MDVVVDVGVGEVAAEEFHAPSKEAVDEPELANVVFECGESLVKGVRGVFLARIHAEEGRRVEFGNVVRLERVLDRDLPVRLILVIPTHRETRGTGEASGDLIETLADECFERRGGPGKRNKDELSTGCDRERVKPGVLAFERSKAVSLGDAARGAIGFVFPSVILALEGFEMAASVTVDETVAVGADVPKGNDLAIEIPENHRNLEEFGRDEIAGRGQLSTAADKMPAG